MPDARTLLRWSGPPLALQITGLLLAGLVVAQLVTLALTLLLPPEPPPQYDLADIATALAAAPDRPSRNPALRRAVQVEAPAPAGPGWLTSERSRHDLARLLDRDDADVQLWFYTPLPFAGTTRGAPRLDGRVGMDDPPPAHSAGTRVPSLPGASGPARLVLVDFQVGPGPRPPGGSYAPGAPPANPAAPGLPPPGLPTMPSSPARPPISLPPSQVTPPPRPTVARPDAVPSPGNATPRYVPAYPPVGPCSGSTEDGPVRCDARDEGRPPGRAGSPDASVRGGGRPAVPGAPADGAGSATPAVRALAVPEGRSDAPAATRGAGERGGPSSTAPQASPSVAASRPGPVRQLPTPLEARATPGAPPTAAAASAASWAGRGAASDAVASGPSGAGEPAAARAPGAMPLLGAVSAAGVVVSAPRAGASAPPTAAPSAPTLRAAAKKGAASGTAPVVEAARPARGLFGLAAAPFVEGDFIAALRTEGGWAVVQPAPVPFPNAWQRRVLLWFAIAAAIVAPLGWLYSRRLVQPIAGFAAAAERLGRDPTAEVLPLDGPAEVGRAAHAFNRMQTRLRSFVDDRTAMIGAISHDLRTPLTRMRFRIEDVPDALRPGLLHEVEAMEQMISSVLAFIRDASEPGSREVLDLSTLVEDVVEEAVFVGQDVTVDANQSTAVEVDAIGMRRLLANLVENAVKYGGSARVRLYAERQEAVTEVVDAGPGLAEDELERVFEPFYRTEAARSSGKQGSGLGLAVCRSIARAHGGDVQLRRGAGDGLVAQVRLPLAYRAAA